MARGGGDRERRRSPKDTGRRTAKKKVCVFCSEHIRWVDYKDVNLLRRYMSDRGKIRARRVSGNCAQHQRDVAVAIKTARELALLPYSQRTVAERGGGRGRPPREDREDRDDRRGRGAGEGGVEVEREVGADMTNGEVSGAEGESPARAQPAEGADVDAGLADAEAEHEDGS
ncbi:MAG: 30S ribosomal protein S18 [Acidimicrobiia bacterium]|nr:30S ribosomal protein S18 [Acidimicrobiia bacterium]